MTIVSPLAVLGALHTRAEWRHGDAKARSVARWMTVQAARDATAPEIESAARGAFSGLDGRDARAHAVASRAWMRRNIVYTKDPLVVEQVETPRAILRRGVADCDGSVLQAAMLLNAGQRVQVVLWGPDNPGPFTHVFVEVLDRGGQAWVADWVAKDDMLERVGSTGRREIFPASPAVAGLRAQVMVRHVAGEQPAALDGLGNAPDPSERMVEAVWVARGKVGDTDDAQLARFRAAGQEGAGFIDRADVSPSPKWGPALPVAAASVGLALWGFLRRAMVATAPTLVTLLADLAKKGALYAVAVAVAQSADPRANWRDPLSVLIGLFKSAGVAITAALSSLIAETRKVIDGAQQESLWPVILLIIGGFAAYRAAT